MILPTSQFPLSESVDEEEEEGEGENGCYRRGHQPQSEVADTSRHGVIPLVTNPLAARVTNPEAAATLGRGAEHGAAEDRQLPETSTNLQVFEGQRRCFKRLHLFEIKCYIGRPYINLVWDSHLMAPRDHTN